MNKSKLMISKKLGRLDLNRKVDEIQLTTYWCRVAYTEFEKWNPKEHSHSFWELHLCLSGNARIISDKNEYVLTENTYLVLCPKEKHTILFQSDDYSEFVWGFCMEDSKETEEELYNRYKEEKVIAADAQMLFSVCRILNNIEKAEFGYYDIIRNELYHIFILIARKAGLADLHEDYTPQNNKSALIRKYVCENLTDNITAEDVASFFCVSKSSVERMCKKEYGLSFLQMKNEVRAEVIRKLLKETDCTMEEISTATGFSDRYSMGKFFKKFEGLTPGDYRRGTKK